MIRSISRFLSGSGFPIFTLTALACWELVLVGFLLVPSPPGGFAEEFRAWCFGADPVTGEVSLIWVSAMLTPPWMLVGITLLVWWEPLQTVTLRSALPAATAAVLLSTLGALGLADGVEAQDGEALTFQAEALRTRHPRPELVLIDQNSDPVDLSKLRGEVVVLTAIYAHCAATCPLILTQLQAATDGLTPAERADLRVVAVTMDPEKDTPEVLQELATRYGLAAPAVHLTTGDPAEVNRVLDDMGISRQRDPETGVISHANLYVVVDREGHVAYRFTLGERQQTWLTEALRLLLAEPSPSDLG